VYINLPCFSFTPTIYTLVISSVLITNWKRMRFLIVYFIHVIVSLFNYADDLKGFSVKHSQHIM